MPRKLRSDPRADALIISVLSVLNAIVLKEAFITDCILYRWLFITVPLLLIAIFKKQKREQTILRNGPVNRKSGHLN
jgi:hypothetical protein